MLLRRNACRADLHQVLLLASPDCRPGQPTLDMTHTKAVYAKCSNPTTYTSLTSPVFNTYLADLGATFDGATPILLSAE